MVTIIYYADPATEPTLVRDYATVSDFLCENFTTQDELLDLRFFEDDLLSHELDQTGGEFLDINIGTIAVTHDSKLPRGVPTWVWFLVAAVVAVVAVVSFKPDIPSVKGRDQSSSTNRLGDTENEPRINERIDDIFGTVNKHMPSLWQVPYRVGVNDQETEILFMCVGRGRYEINENEWFDGDTPVKDIPNASVSVYGPGNHPGNGSPFLQIGPDITESIGVYRQSKDLNPAELEPPNAQDTTQIRWTATGSGSVATLSASDLPSGFSLTERYQEGDQITLNGCNYLAPDDVIGLFINDTGEGGNYYPTFFAPVDLSEGSTLFYTVTAVTSTQLTLTIPAGATPAVIAAWAAMSNYTFPTVAVNIKTITPAPGPTNTWVTDPSIINLYYYEAWGEPDAVVYRSITQDVRNFYISVGVAFKNGIGPIIIPKGSTHAIMNFVSPNGFYKLVENSEQMLYAQIKIIFYELDNSGNETGLSFETGFWYSSNPTSTRRSVFRTQRIALPYTYQKVTCERVTNRDKSDNVSNVDVVEWRDLYTFQPVSVSSFGDVTTAHVVIPSNSQSRLIKQRKQNVNVTRKITEYLGNGVFGPTEDTPTDSFEQILIHTALDPYIGRLNLSEINADGFLDLRDEITAYFGNAIYTKFGYDFDTTEMTYQDTYTLICNTVMCIPYIQAGVYDAFFERRQDTSAMQITCRNKIPESEVRKIIYDRKYDGVEVTYRDNGTGTSETIYIPLDRSARNPERVTFEGCTTSEQATKLAYRLYNKQLYQFESVKFDVDDFGRNIVPGRRIDSPDSTRFTKRANVTDGYRVYDGEVLAASGLAIRLSEPVYFTAGEDHYITFTKEDGTNTESIFCTQIDEYHILLSTLPSEPIYTGYQRDRTKYMLVSEQRKESVALIPKTIEFSMSDDGIETHSVSCVNYSHNYYKNDGAIVPVDELYVKADYVDDDYVDGSPDVPDTTYVATGYVTAGYVQ